MVDHGLIQGERNINIGEKVEAIHMISRWTHSIINLSEISEMEELVTAMTGDRKLDLKKPDSFWKLCEKGK